MEINFNLLEFWKNLFTRYDGTKFIENNRNFTIENIHFLRFRYIREYIGKKNFHLLILELITNYIGLSLSIVLFWISYHDPSVTS